MGTTKALLISLGICVIAAVLEGLCSGKGVKQYFAKLKLPRYSAPLWVWYIIGGLYYLVFFYVIYRLLRRNTGEFLTQVTLVFILFMMALNALWNYVFFRAQNLLISFIVASLFPLLDVILLILLVQLDRAAAWALVPYLIYRVYGAWWGYGFWKANRIG